MKLYDSLRAAALVGAAAVAASLFLPWYQHEIRLSDRAIEILEFSTAPSTKSETLIAASLFPSPLLIGLGLVLLVTGTLLTWRVAKPSRPWLASGSLALAGTALVAAGVLWAVLHRPDAYEAIHSDGEPDLDFPRFGGHAGFSRLSPS